MKKMKKAQGLLSVHLFIDCPYCDEQHDLFSMDGVNDEGEIWNRAFQSDRWKNDRDAWREIGYEIECTKCDKAFIFDEIEY